jgi:hypothetical protein
VAAAAAGQLGALARGQPGRADRRGRGDRAPTDRGGASGRGAQELLSSVSEFGARYFAHVVTGAGTGKGANGKPVRWLAVVPLADAVTLPVCVLPQNVIVVPAFHGGLLGDPNVLPTVTDFLSGGQATAVADKDGRLRAAAEAIAGAATAWRMPQTTSDPC